MNEPQWLTSSEEWWKDRQPMLASRGYRLRARYQPGWTPSWYTNKKYPDQCEDSIQPQSHEIMDATRDTAPTKVMIKRIRVVPENDTNRHEVQIHRFLTTPEKLSNPANHCVPLLDCFRDTIDPTYTFIVIPLLLPFDMPKFTEIGEVVEFARQTLEGLAYMHSVGVAHRDCYVGNIMMSSEHIAPEGFHPWSPDRDVSGIRSSKLRRRSELQANQVKYYFIDFGISVMYSDPRQPRLALGMNGQVQTPPELSDVTPYDPFALDVFILGELFHLRFFRRFKNLGFLQDLIVRMTYDIPANRPTARQAFNQFTVMAAKISKKDLGARLEPYGEGTLRRLGNNAIAAVRQAI